MINRPALRMSRLSSVRVHAKCERMNPGHILTGPIAVEGAQPATSSRSRSLDIQLRQKLGLQRPVRRFPGRAADRFRPDAGAAHSARQGEDGRDHALGRRSPARALLRRHGRGPDPRLEPDPVDRAARSMGGNLDNKELVPGASLFLPVFAEGGLFSCGERPWRAGDGEVCVTAIEDRADRALRLHAA